jgi:hypothetical protein
MSIKAIPELDAALFGTNGEGSKTDPPRDRVFCPCCRKTTLCTEEFGDTGVVLWDHYDDDGKPFYPKPTHANLPWRTLYGYSCSNAALGCSYTFTTPRVKAAALKALEQLRQEIEALLVIPDDLAPEGIFEAYEEARDE